LKPLAITRFIPFFLFDYMGGFAKIIAALGDLKVCGTV